MSAELLRALAVLAEPPTPESSRLADLVALGRPPTADEFTELFAFQVYPYASVYTGAEGALGGEARDRVAGFWRVLGLAPPTEPDHVSALLGLYAELVERSRVEGDGPGSEAWRRARATCLWEHLLSWLGPYLRKVEQLAHAPFRMWAARLREVLWADAQVVAAPPTLPLHLRLAPPLPEADADADTWLSALLAPVRCGLILTRADLARAARDLGLGRRVGDRRAVLRALFEQDAPRASEWLAAQAEASAAAAEADTAPLGAVAVFWTVRARETARALERARAGETIDGR